MRMAVRRLAVLAAGLCVSAGFVSAAGAQQSCSSGRAGCEAVCTPDRVWRYYGGVSERCTASCTPRWQQCLRSGIWVDLERLSTGYGEPASRY